MAVCDVVGVISRLQVKNHALRFSWTAKDRDCGA
jgi:hypothetical protein